MGRTPAGKAEANFVRRNRSIFKRHFKSRTYDQDVAEYGTRVADFNAGWLDGWADGERNGKREAKAAAKAKRK